MKRRTLLTTGLPLLLLGGAIALSAADEKKQESTPALKVLMICGGCCHDYESQKLILSEGISARANVEFTVVHEGPGPKVKESRDHKVSIYEKEDWAKGYDLVLHNECFGAVNDDAFIERIAKPHFEGVPAVMLHCSSHSYRTAKTDEWRKCLGISSLKHENNRDLLIKTINAEHPVMQGFPNEWLNKADELYINDKVWENAVPLAKSFGEETQKDHTVIWVNTYGKGKVFATTLGHGNDTMADPIYLDLVTRGLLWAAGKLDDQGKPLPGYGPIQ